MSMKNVTKIPVEHSETVAVWDTTIQPDTVTLKLFASGDDCVVIGPNARRALAARLLRDLDPAPLDDRSGDVDGAVLEHADPKELQNDGDPIKEAATPPGWDKIDGSPS